MDVVGSEIGQKMRSAIKAKLTELGCYVDDELPDYVMVMVANKRTRAQMDEDLQLFLGDNTELFVNWLHQVLKKLQEVTVTAPLKAMEVVKTKERSQSKERKSKEKKDKGKKKSECSKKAKKKEKEKLHKKKEERKVHKNKKKSKHHEMIHPNVPPLLMNIEKESEPSITDVFAGQILKNHGITLEDDNLAQKSLLKETKRPILPIIDPATISSQPEDQINVSSNSNTLSVGVSREEHLKESNDIDGKVPVKNKLPEQLDSMSDDEDFLNIRTEAEELMNDFAEESFQEISQISAPLATPPLVHQSSLLHSQPMPREKEEILQDALPHIELNLPKRPIRERLRTRDSSKERQVVREKEKVTATKPAESPERFTPERQPEIASKSGKSRLGATPEPPNPSSRLEDDHVDKSEQTHRRTSKVSVLESRATRVSCASVVRVRPRPRVSAPASNLLLKAVADAHKSLLNAPPKVEIEKQKVKRALVLPMRRCMDAQNIVIQVPSAMRTDETPENETPIKQRNSATPSKEDFKHMNIKKVIKNTDYVPNRTATQKDDKMIIETINIHNPTVNKDRDTQFIVTMDGYLPNAFLAKKLMMEGILDEEDIDKDKLTKPIKSVLRATDKSEKGKDKDESNVEKQSNKVGDDNKIADTCANPTEKSSDAIDDISKKQPSDSSKAKKKNKNDTIDSPSIEITDTNDTQTEKISQSSDKPLKRLSNTSEESDTQVIIKQEQLQQSGEKRKSANVIDAEKPEKVLEVPPVKKRKASPIVFDTDKVEKEAERARERTQSASSDSHVVVTTATNSHKYDSVPPLSQAEKKLVWCRSFPVCRYGASCAFAHPRCKFAAACTRRGCVYAHAPAAAGLPAAPPATTPVLASHVVPAANYKSIVAAGAANMCKFYPNCVNPACHYYHPKPCRYGKACVNKLECNFFHNDVPLSKWKYPV